MKKVKYNFDKSFMLFYSIRIGNIIPSDEEIEKKDYSKYWETCHNLNCLFFKKKINETAPQNIKQELEMHLSLYIDKGGDAVTWINETKQHHYNLTPEQLYVFRTTIKEMLAKYDNVDGEETPLELQAISNELDFVSINNVYNHFKVGLVDKKYISDEVLIRFIKLAFNEKTKPKPKNKFVLNDVRSKQKIIKVFSEYYHNLAGKPYGQQQLYAALLGDYFVGYKTPNVSSNFSK